MTSLPNIDKFSFSWSKAAGYYTLFLHSDILLVALYFQEAWLKTLVQQHKLLLNHNYCFKYFLIMAIGRYFIFLWYPEKVVETKVYRNIRINKS